MSVVRRKKKSNFGIQLKLLSKINMRSYLLLHLISNRLSLFLTGLKTSLSGVQLPDWHNLVKMRKHLNMFLLQTIQSSEVMPIYYFKIIKYIYCVR